MTFPLGECYQLMPPLSAAEYEALKADIALQGVLVPVEVDADTGAVLDGHHRLRAARELGIEPPTISRRFASDAERIAHVVALNLKRRHLDPVTWGEFFIRYVESRGTRSGIQGRQPEKTDTVSVLARELGLSDRTARRRMAAARLPEPLREKVRTGERSLTAAVTEDRRQRRVETATDREQASLTMTAEAPRASNGIIPLEVMWPTPRTLLRAVADQYLRRLEDLRKLGRERPDIDAAAFEQRGVAEAVANLEAAMKEIEQAIARASTTVQDRALELSELADVAPTYPVPWGSDKAACLSANALQKKSRGYCGHVGCWQTADEAGRCKVHPSGTEYPPSEDRPPAGLFEPAEPGNAARTRPVWSVWGLEALA